MSEGCFVKTKKLFFFIAAILFLSGCGWWKGKELRRNSPEALYQIGDEDSQTGRYEIAIESIDFIADELELKPKITSGAPIGREASIAA